MRKIFLICSVLMALMTVAPLTAIERIKSVSVSADNLQENGEYVSVMLSESGKVEKMDAKEYLVGVLAAETDASFHEEALKAQAVACYTYMLYMRNSGRSDDFNGADVSDSSEECQGYINRDERMERWGEKFDENENKINSAVDEVFGKTIAYNGEAILAAYHNISSGATEDAETVWGKEYPYLLSVESPGDKLSTEYSKTVVMSLKEFMDCAVKIKGLALSGDASKWLGKSDTSETGYVKSIELGGTSVKGSDFRQAFGLKSCNFTVSYENEKFTIRTLGDGHMVGMSQYGADYMARQGASWQEILNYYYANIEII